jgi:hypothetical protein
LPIYCGTPGVFFLSFPYTSRSISRFGEELADAMAAEVDCEWHALGDLETRVHQCDDHYSLAQLFEKPEA